MDFNYFQMDALIKDSMLMENLKELEDFNGLMANFIKENGYQE
jgi:trans-2-enoyl-CoA reductase